MCVVKSESAHSGRHSRGAVIVLVMLIVTILTIAGISLFFMSYHSSVRSIRMAEETACRILTDAGLRRAIGTLNAQYRDGTLDDYDLPMSVGETVQGMTGTFSYQITKDANGVYFVTSFGESGNFRRTQVAQLEIQAKPYFDNAILAMGFIDVAPSMTISAYDPDDPTAPMGTYPATIGTLRTGSIGIDVSGTVYGDAFCGVGGEPSVVIAGDENITGSTYALTEEPEMELPEMPTDVPNYGSLLEINSTTVTLTPADSGIYSNIKLKSTGTPAIVYIDGGTVTLGSTGLMQMGNDAEIIVNEGSTLLLYLNDGISSMSGASITYNSTTPDPTHIQIYGTCTEPEDNWSLKSKDVFQGVVYAPNSFVSINAGSQIIGAVVCSSFASASGIEYLYDMSLKDATNIALGGGGNGYAVDRWSESLSSGIPEWAQ